MSTLTALCLVSEAANAQKAGGHLRAPLKQTFLDAPLNQEDSDTDMESDDDTSTESSETDSDTDSDTSSDTDTDSDTESDPNDLANTGNQAAGNQLPNVQAGRNLPNTHQEISGSNAGKNAGIAFAALALVGVVVAGAVFVINKYRRDLLPAVRI